MPLPVQTKSLEPVLHRGESTTQLSLIVSLPLSTQSAPSAHVNVGFRLLNRL